MSEGSVPPTVLLQLLEAHDYQKNGQVRVTDFQDILAEHGLQYGMPAVDKMMVLSNIDDSGVIHYAKFANWVMEESQKSNRQISVPSAGGGEAAMSPATYESHLSERRASVGNHQKEIYELYCAFEANELSEDQLEAQLNALGLPLSEAAHKLCQSRKVTGSVRYRDFLMAISQVDSSASLSEMRSTPTKLGGQSGTPSETLRHQMKKPVDHNVLGWGADAKDESATARSSVGATKARQSHAFDVATPPPDRQMGHSSGTARDDLLEMLRLLQAERVSVAEFRTFLTGALGGPDNISQDALLCLRTLENSGYCNFRALSKACLLGLKGSSSSSTSRGGGGDRPDNSDNMSEAGSEWSIGGGEGGAGNRTGRAGPSGGRDRDHGDIFGWSTAPSAQEKSTPSKGSSPYSKRGGDNVINWGAPSVAPVTTQAYHNTQIHGNVPAQQENFAPSSHRNVLTWSQEDIQVAAATNKTHGHGDVISWSGEADALQRKASFGKKLFHAQSTAAPFATTD
jgi:Ca2+-binding EF-hand superfamily protein